MRDKILFFTFAVVLFPAFVARTQQPTRTPPSPPPTPTATPTPSPSPTPSPNENAGVEIIWGVRIPMRDGVRLNATVYRPANQTASLPVIFTLTPYIADSYHNRALYFARNGYVFALVDARGRGNSEGRFEPFANEGRDGHDITEGLARQSWSNGRVTMWGGSYAGTNQWQTLMNAPAHLSTIVPVASAYPSVDFPFFKNIFFSYDMQWLTFTSGVTPNANLFGEASFWNERFYSHYIRHLPFAQLDRTIGNASTHFQTWLQHPTPDEYWDRMTPTREQYARMNVPILTITGHYDGDQRGAMEFYRRFMQHASPEARNRHYLIIGPWDHAGTRTPRAEFGGLRFGQASMLDMNKLHREWYDWTMKAGARPEFLRNRVAYYVVGANGTGEWKYVDSLEAISNERQTFYLSSAGAANDLFHSGTLRAERPTQTTVASGSYVYNPLDTRYAELEREDVENYLTSQRAVNNLFGNGLVYHSEPFEGEREVTGYLRFVAWMAIDTPDTDFQVDVYEVLPDGTSVYLTGDMMRARYRESLREARLVRPNEVNQYEFNAFQFFSRRISHGSRLRLIISSPNSISIERNFNGGGVVAEESGRDARTCRVTLYHTAERPSFLEIPVVR